jgi:hypothetical protein
LDNILAAQEHELRRLGRGLLERAQALKRVFVQVAQAGINRRPAPGFQAGELHLIEDGRGGQHLRRGHAGGGHGLVAVAQDGIVKADSVPVHNHSVSAFRRPGVCPLRQGICRGISGAGTGSLPVKDAHTLGHPVRVRMTFLAKA